MSSPQIQIKIGADPELFLKYKGKYVSAHDILPGTKAKPYLVPGGAIQVDGVAAEFNITPANNYLIFQETCQLVISELMKMLPTGYSLEYASAVEFEPTYFKSLPVKVRQLGCNMDWNAWTGQPNPQPDGDNTTVRGGAGHIHIGWTSGENIEDSTHIQDCCIVAKQLDYYLGVPSLLWDNDSRRRLLYGKAGAFRPKEYGIEYRTPSNRWCTSPALMTWVYSAAFWGVRSIIDGQPRLYEKFGNYAQKIIDGNQYEEVKGNFRKEIFHPKYIQNLSWPKW